MGNQQVMPPEENVDVRIPSKEYVEHPFSLGRFLSYPIAIVFFLLVIGGTIWNVTPIKRLFSGSSTANKPTAVVSKPTVPIKTTPVVVPSPPTDCLDQPPLPTNQQPALFFCSPQFQGNFAGPFGTHIVLVGEYFPSLHTRWALHANPFTGNIIPNGCTTTMKNDCLILPTPDSIKQISPNIFSIAWTWQKPFPTTPGNYFITAQNNNAAAFTTHPNFTLLSAKNPCIVIYALLRERAQPPDCPSTPTTITLSGNVPPINIQGNNWKLGWTQPEAIPADMLIHIIATCSTPSLCHKSLLFSITIKGNELTPNGSFWQHIALTARAIQVKGSYRVIAWNEIPNNIIPGSSFNTAANNALIFGGSKSDLLVLKIV